MKKRVLGLILATVMVATALVGCGGTKGSAGTATDGGKVLNIYCWNEEFQSRVTDHYPGYEKIDGTTGKIGDVTVVWNITPNADNAYQNNLDEALMNQASKAADEKVDIFLIEADYALKYVDTEYALPVETLGIKTSDLKDQYKYTQDIVTDSNGVLKGVSWQGCPGALFYNREVAKEVLGTDDPAEVQKAVASWDKFTETAATMQAAGYYMTSSVMDTYRVYSNNVSTKWVVNDKIVIDDNIKKWVEDSKKMVDAGQTKTHTLWSTEWNEGFYPAGKVFCYFGPAWLINFCMAADQEGSVGYNGDWGCTEGPQGFFWGGTWICAANGTDNSSLVKDIMLKLTADADIMKGIVLKDDDFANNKPAMEAMAQSDYTSKIMGGQNPLPIFAAGAGSIDLSNLSAYDQGCNEQFQNAMKQYFDGVATYEEALDLFYKAVVEKYPNLTY